MMEAERMDTPQFPEARVAEMIAEIAAYMQGERSLYLRASDSLSPTWKTTMQPYFPKALLDTVKTITLDGARIPPPPFYSEAVAMSGGHFPDFVHLASVTYIDIIVFNDAILPRTLFHGLVHAQQIVSDRGNSICTNNCRSELGSPGNLWGGARGRGGDAREAEFCCSNFYLDDCAASRHSLRSSS